MTDYPSHLECDIVLKDGGLARLRPIRSDDAIGLEAFFSRLSRDSIYQRFFRAKQRLTSEELVYFTTLDYDTRMAFVVTSGDHLIGVGRYDRLPDQPTEAEVAFVVEDGHQGRGIGTHLLVQLTAYARACGIERFVAWVLADNYPMLRVFRNSGYRLQRDLEAGTYRVEFPTEMTPEALAAEEANEQKAVTSSLLPIFYPRSIAVIGASRQPTSMGGRLFENLIRQRFSGTVYPVNPNAEAVASVKAYPRVTDIPDRVDLAVVVVPSTGVLEVAHQCAEKGVRGMVVISAGFSETGEAGKAVENELVGIARAAGMRLVGPNCMGLLNTDPAVCMNGTFGPVYPPAGNVGMSSQSGALGLALLDYAARLGIGISSFISVGNKADVSGNDLLIYWEGDPATDVIVLYLESFGNPRRFARLARRIAKTKPIVAVKSGRTKAGTRAASSHTGALASREVAVEALFHQSGVIRTDTLDELFDVTTLLANQPLPAGRRVGIVSNAGGPAILAADALESHGLRLPEFSSQLQAGLRQALNPEAAVVNPVDMIASAGPGQYRACLDLLLASDEVDAVIAIFIPASPEGTEEIVAAIREAGAAHAGEKTFLAVYMRADGSAGSFASEGSRVPAYQFPESAARALGRVANYAEWKTAAAGSLPSFADIDEARARTVVEAALRRLDGQDGWMAPDEVANVLESFGLRLPAERVASSVEQATKAAGEVGFPVVLKLIAPSVLHKTDVGGVLLDVSGEEAVAEGFRKLMSLAGDAEGVLVQEYLPGGHEVIIGATEDPSFGPLIAVGLGGVFAELFSDVAFRIHPITDSDAAEMISGLKASRLLQGYRGNPAGDVAALQDALLRISVLVEVLPELAEMDLNPVKVFPPGEGLRVVDARMRVRPVHARREDLPATKAAR